MKTTNNVPTFNCVMFGVGSTGRTIIIKRYLMGELTKEYVAALGAKELCIMLHTNRGAMRFNVWDTIDQYLVIPNFLKQFFLLARKFIGDPNLKLSAAPALVSPDDREWRECAEAELEEAQETELPPDDDEDL